MLTPIAMLANAMAIVETCAWTSVKMQKAAAVPNAEGSIAASEYHLLRKAVRHRKTIIAIVAIRHAYPVAARVGNLKPRNLFLGARYGGLHLFDNLRAFGGIGGIENTLGENHAVFAASVQNAAAGHVRKPNAAHLAIAGLEKDYNVTVITQNVDNLHERAGSTRIIHLHGELTKVRPENRCNYRDGFSEAEVFDIGYGEIHLGDLAPNGAQLRPHIVWFGESVPKIEAAIEAVEAADILLIVGTSLQVYPAAGLYRYAGPDTHIYIIDPKDVPAYDSRITHIHDVATRGMEKFCSLLGK